MRLRRKPWVDEAIHAYDDFVTSRDQQIDETSAGKWHERFGRSAPLYVELGTGKGDFITELAKRHRDINFIGIEMQQDVIYQAAKKAAEQELTNIRLLVFDINKIESIFARGEVDRFFINFCDPWPKKRHAKRRLTHRLFLEKYRNILSPGGRVHFKTDNHELFLFSLTQFEEAGLKMENLTFDLHAEEPEWNIKTEYERKFSELGSKIHRVELAFS